MTHLCNLEAGYGDVWASNFGGAAPGFEPRTSCLRVRSVTITLRGAAPINTSIPFFAFVFFEGNKGPLLRLHFLRGLSGEKEIDCIPFLEGKGGGEREEKKLEELPKVLPSFVLSSISKVGAGFSLYAEKTYRFLIHFCTDYYTYFNAPS